MLSGDVIAQFSADLSSTKVHEILHNKKQQFENYE